MALFFIENEKGTIGFQSMASIINQDQSAWMVFQRTLPLWTKEGALKGVKYWRAGAYI
jgi:hypothetical protein